MHIGLFQAVRKTHSEKILQLQEQMDQDCVLKQQATLRDELPSLVQDKNKQLQSREGCVTSLEDYAEERAVRCKHFIEVLQHRRQSFLDKLSPLLDQ